jgi:hypothetical protein
MFKNKLPPPRPVHTCRVGGVQVSCWKWVDGHGLRYELTVDRAYDEGQQKSRYPERFRADQVNNLRVAIDMAESWLQIREKQTAELTTALAKWLERRRVLAGQPPESNHAEQRD